MAHDAERYSKKPLSEKLGVKAGSRVAVLNAPSGFDEKLYDSPSIVVTEALPGYLLDLILLFVADKEELEDEFPALEGKLARSGVLWVCWPKRSSGVKTDLDDVAVREAGLGNRLVDVKVAAIDETWSGLKFVRRVGDRR